MNYTISEVKKKLQTIQTEDDPFIEQCLRDERKGVQTLIKQWMKRKHDERIEYERVQKLLTYEKELRANGYQWIAGIDEVGRGPLAGPVVASAVILPAGIHIPGINDSKKLTAKKREKIYQYLQEKAISTGIGVVEAEEIDTLNIYDATKKAMILALNNLSIQPDYLLIDAMTLPTSIPQKSLIKGDAVSISIASASIIAKVYRDRIMTEYSNQYPQYQFNKNMGYGTKEHLQALEKYGPTPIHRKSFSPIKEMVSENLFTIMKSSY